MDSFGRLVRFALLTAQRRDKLAEMQWADLDGNVWKIRTEDREKGNAGELVLPDLAIEVLGARACGFVFPTKGGKKHNDWIIRNRLEKLSGVTGWTLHDLRRTARSLMARAEVRPDVAERVLGHALGGVEGIYNRHPTPKRRAMRLTALAGLVGLILDPPSANVVGLR